MKAVVQNQGGTKRHHGHPAGEQHVRGRIGLLLFPRLVDKASADEMKQRAMN